MKKIDPSYYSILPADVRYNPNLSSSAKLLFSEITALCNKSGKCWASNAYFARLYSVSDKTVSQWIGELKTNGYLDSYTEDMQRILTIGKNGIPLLKNTETPTEKGNDPLPKKVTQNNTSINNKVNTKSNKDSWLQKAVGLYSLFWKEMYGQDYVVANWGRLGKTLQSLSSLNEWQLATLIWLHFNWYGASGDDQKTYKYLADKFFPLEWIPNNLNGYKAYLVNTLDVKWDDEIAMKKFILPELKKVKYEEVH